MGVARSASIARSLHTSFGLRLRYWGNMDLLASEQARIQRTAARSEHREGGAQHAEMNERPRICRMGEGETELSYSNRAAGDWRPQTHEQKDCGSRRRHLRDDGSRRINRQQPRTNQWSRGDRAQKQ